MRTVALVARFNAAFDRSSAIDEGADAPILIHLHLGQPAVPTAERGPDELNRAGFPEAV